MFHLYQTFDFCMRRSRVFHFTPKEKQKKTKKIKERDEKLESIGIESLFPLRTTGGRCNRSHLSSAKSHLRIPLSRFDIRKIREQLSVNNTFFFENHESFSNKNKYCVLEMSINMSIFLVICSLQNTGIDFYVNLWPRGSVTYFESGSKIQGR